MHHPSSPEPIRGLEAVQGFLGLFSCRDVRRNAKDLVGCPILRKDRALDSLQPTELAPAIGNHFFRDKLFLPGIHDVKVVPAKVFNLFFVWIKIGVRLAY